SLLVVVGPGRASVLTPKAPSIECGRARDAKNGENAPTGAPQCAPVFGKASISFPCDGSPGLTLRFTGRESGRPVGSHPEEGLDDDTAQLINAGERCNIVG